MSIRIRVTVTSPSRMANTGHPVAFKKSNHEDSKPMTPSLQYIGVDYHSLLKFKFGALDFFWDKIK